MFLRPCKPKHYIDETERVGSRIHVRQEVVEDQDRHIGHVLQRCGHQVEALRLRDDGRTIGQRIAGPIELRPNQFSQLDNSVAKSDCQCRIDNFDLVCHLIQHDSTRLPG